GACLGAAWFRTTWANRGIGHGGRRDGFIERPDRRRIGRLDGQGRRGEYERGNGRENGSSALGGDARFSHHGSDVGPTNRARKNRSALPSFGSRAVVSDGPAHRLFVFDTSFVESDAAFALER